MLKSLRIRFVETTANDFSVLFNEIVGQTTSHDFYVTYLRLLHSLEFLDEIGNFSMLHLIEIAIFELFSNRC